MLTYWVAVSTFAVLFSAFRVWLIWASEHQTSAVDWNRVYAMERAVWGRTFEHLGAPAPRSLPGFNPFDHPRSSWQYQNVEAAALLTINELREREVLVMGKSVIDNPHRRFDELRERMYALDAAIQKEYSNETQKRLRAKRAEVWKELAPLAEALANG